MLSVELTGMNLKGVFTALVTPVKRGRADVARFADLVDIARSAGISGIVPLGTTGESPALDDAVRSRIITTTVKAADGRLSVIVGAGSNNTFRTIESVRQAAGLGTDAVLIVAPYYNKPTQEGLKRHFLTIADRSPVPVVLYHIPSRCGVGIPLELVLELAKHPRIIGIKEAGGDIWRSGEIARLTGDDFAVLSGDDNLTLPLLAVGASGVISVISNIAPKVLSEMVESMHRGDLTGALKINRKLSPLLKALSLETNPGPIKEAMKQAGKSVGDVLPPLAPVRPKTRQAIKHALQEVGSIE